MTIETLEDLLSGRLDRELLYVFVAGPGVGEGILVALPGGGWIAVDGCEVAGKGCLVALLEKWKSDTDQLELVVLTHPHDDHAAGIPYLIEKHEPRQVMLTGATPGGPTLLQISAGLITELRRSITEDGTKLRHAKKAIDALAVWAEKRGNTVAAGADGVSWTWGDTTASVRAPHACAHLTMVLDEIADGTMTHANEASLVLELAFGKTRVVLGGDLPVRRTGAGPVPTGWDGVMTRHPALANNNGLKLPHHGSEHAQHTSLLGGSGDAIWFVTPGPHKLPRAFEATGLPALVAKRPVHATALPSDADTPVGAAMDGVSVGALRRRPPPTSDPLLAGAVEVTPREPPDAFAPVWGAAFDRTGAVRNVWRGASAVRFTA